MQGLQNIYARNCEVRRIGKTDAAAFLDAHHRLGATGGRYFYGLFVKRTSGKDELRLPPGTLAGVAVFSNARRWQKGERVVSSYEWIRYASLSGTRIVGGMSRVLLHFIEEVRPDDIMTYADTSWEDAGAVYRMLGFEPEAEVERGGAVNLKLRLRVSP